MSITKKGWRRPFPRWISVLVFVWFLVVLSMGLGNFEWFRKERRKEVRQLAMYGI
ncbi:hypothetical protein QUA20_21775 [Microcoleus sp. Pol7_A1]